MKVAFFLSLSIGAVITLLVISGNGGSGSSEDTDAGVNPPTIVNGIQIIEIAARGGYTPRQTIAKANVPTVIHMKTNGTFDCSSSVVIPSIGYSSTLPVTGTTNIDVPAQKTGTILKGMCGMGMYNFNISFS